MKPNSLMIDTLNVAAHNLLKAVRDGYVLNVLTPAELADLAGELKTVQDILAKAQAPIREALLEQGEVIGSCYRTTAVHSVRRSLDTKAVKSELGEDWYNARTVSTEVASLRIVELKASERI